MPNIYGIASKWLADPILKLQVEYLVNFDEKINQLWIFLLNLKNNHEYCKMMVVLQDFHLKKEHMKCQI